VRFARFGPAFLRAGAFFRGAFLRGLGRAARRAVRAAAGARGAAEARGAGEGIFGSAVGMSL